MLPLITIFKSRQTAAELLLTKSADLDEALFTVSIGSALFANTPIHIINMLIG